MSDKKQSAVEWVVKQLTPAISLQQKYIDEIKEEAKQMEQEQNAKSYKKGWDEGTDALYKEVRKIYDANKIFYNIDS